MTAATKTGARRALFVATILAGSFLLFLVQPMVARMALPRLGGAPNVWNSAMLVYQALLLAGYGYAHRLGKMPLRRQAQIHVSLLILAALTLPITLANLPQPAAGQEVFWVPLLLALTIGPVFFLVSAQAPLMQHWFAADADAGEPWALYAASNIGSFTGLIAYPLLAEPGLTIGEQSWGWSIGYGLLIGLVILAARARWNAVDVVTAPDVVAEPVPLLRILLWLALSAVPSGLMLSTTTHLTTDLFAMPLLWVIPLGLYLLSFVVAFSDKRALAWAIGIFAPLLLLLAGGLAMTSRSSGTLALAVASVALLFVVSVALHARLYAERPAASQLTLFYFVMSAGGALGGLFTALIAPLVFDWVWEHPLLVLGAGLLMPLPTLLDWRRLPGLSPDLARWGAYLLLAFAAFLAWDLLQYSTMQNPGMPRVWLTVALALVGVLLLPWRHLFLGVLLLIMLGQGGLETIRGTADGIRTRSYFGIYTVRDSPGNKMRLLTHGTTLHGQQSLDPQFSRVPITYYGPGSGAGIVMAHADQLYGKAARIGVVGLGTGTLACYRMPGQQWRYYEIDPAVLELSRNGKFTYISACAPDAKVAIGDARIELSREVKGSLDVLAIDAFSSDAIPLHLMTDEAFGIYMDVLAPGGVLLVHISNRYIELEPAIAALAKKRGLVAALRDDVPGGTDQTFYTASSWVMLSRDGKALERLRALEPGLAWKPLMPPAKRAWSDDHASILPYVRWQNILGKP